MSPKPITNVQPNGANVALIGRQTAKRLYANRFGADPALRQLGKSACQARGGQIAWVMAAA